MPIPSSEGFISPFKINLYLFPSLATTSNVLLPSSLIDILLSGLFSFVNFSSYVL